MPRDLLSIRAPAPARGAGPRMAAPSDDLRTRRRLLEAAGEVFAEHGYRTATIREICGRAGANLAAVNYHFRDKAGLYSELLAFAYEASIERHPPDLGVRLDDPPATRLRAFVRSFLLRLLDDGRSAWHAQLMCREMSEPTPFLGDAIRAPVSRVHDLLRRILEEHARATGGRLPGDDLARCAMSVVGQCVHYRVARPVIDALYPGRFGVEELEPLTDHITEFTLAGVDRLVRARATAATPGRRRRAAARGRARKEASP